MMNNTDLMLGDSAAMNKAKRRKASGPGHSS